jgi:hypothetical protein
MRGEIRNESRSSSKTLIVGCDRIIVVESGRALVLIRAGHAWGAIGPVG